MYQTWIPFCRQTFIISSTLLLSLMALELVRVDQNTVQLCLFVFSFFYIFFLLLLFFLNWEVNM